MSKHVISLAVIWLTLLLIYSNSFAARLIRDNAPILTRDPRITTLTSDNLHRIWTSEYWFTQTGNGLYRPLTTLSYLVNYSVFGNRDQPAGYHWVNYLLHALNASLLWWIWIYPASSWLQ